jgi:hypothetical protein
MEFKVLRWIYTGLVLLLMTGFILGPRRSAAAQTPTAAPTTPAPAPDSSAQAPAPTPQTGSIPAEELGFWEFKFTDQTLNGPYSTVDLKFGLPADWELLAGAELVLDLGVFFKDSHSSQDGTEHRLLGGLLAVTMNGQPLSTVTLDRVGDTSARLAIPAAALKPVSRDYRHQLELSLSSAETCLFDVETSVIVRASSRFYLPYQQAPLPADLRQLPWPIFQQSPLSPDVATLVVSDRATQEELTAALNVAAGFGRMTGGRLQLDLVTTGQLASQQRDQNHLIFVGKTAGFPGLSLAAFPAPIFETGIDLSGVSPEAGIVQIAPSPWNPARAVLLVSGNNDAAVARAGQAIYAGAVMAQADPALAVVTDVPVREPVLNVPTDRTFEELGYSKDMIKGLGLHLKDYLFYIPPGMVVSENAYAELTYSHSALLDYWRSGLVITLNGEPVGSARFSDESTQMGKLHVDLPASAIRPGNNLLTVEVHLNPRDYCMNAQFQDEWMTIWPGSQIHIPLIPAFQGGTNHPIELRDYPNLLSTNPSKGKLAFVLPVEAQSWKVAGRLAFDLGYLTGPWVDGRADLPVIAAANQSAANTWGPPEILAVFDGELPEALYQNYNLLLVGIPSDLALLGTLGDSAPLLFEPGSDTPANPSLQSGFPTQGSPGYLELIVSPANAGPSILAVLGSTEQSMGWAARALSQTAARDQLSGDYALVYGESLLVGDSQISGSSPAQPSATEQAGQIKPPSGTFLEGRSPWILAALVLILALIVIVLALVARNARQPDNSY